MPASETITLVAGEWPELSVWEVRRKAKQVEIHEGDLSSVSCSSRRTFSSVDQAAAFVDQEAAAKLGAGFRRPTPVKIPDADFRVHVSRCKPVFTENSDFLEQIASSGQDRAAFLVYGDWLQDKGDPRGLLIAVQADEGDKRVEREELLFRTYSEQLVPAKSAMFGGQAEWHLGFIQSLRVDFTPWREEAVPSLAMLLTHPSCRLLSTLEIRHVHSSIAEPVVSTIAREAARELTELSITPSLSSAALVCKFSSDPRRPSSAQTCLERLSETLRSLTLPVDHHYELRELVRYEWKHLRFLEVLMNRGLSASEADALDTLLNGVAPIERLNIGARNDQYSTESLNALRENCPRRVEIREVPPPRHSRWSLRG